MNTTYKHTRDSDQMSFPGAWDMRLERAREWSCDIEWTIVRMCPGTNRSPCSHRVYNNWGKTMDSVQLSWQIFLQIRFLDWSLIYVLYLCPLFVFFWWLITLFLFFRLKYTGFIFPYDIERFAFTYCVKFFREISMTQSLGHTYFYCFRNAFYLFVFFCFETFFF